MFMNSSRHRNILTGALVLLFLSFAANSLAQINDPLDPDLSLDHPEVKPWSTSFFNSVNQQFDGLKYKFVRALFEGTVEADLFNQNLGQNFHLGSNIRREIYNNYDIFETWTVIDQWKLKIDASPDVASLKSPSPIPALNSVIQAFSLSGGIGLGANGVLQIRDYRQVIPKDLTGFKERRKKVVVADDEERSNDVVELNPYLNEDSLDSPFRPKVRDILNPIKLPFRLPFSRKAFRSMEEGELISYNISGQLLFGGSLGWNFIPNPMVQVGLNLSVETHINSAFQISVLKEDERFAKVRVGYLNGRGSSEEIGLEIHVRVPYQDLKGLDHVSNTLKPNLIESFRPYYFRHATQKNAEVDLGYRYDLDSIDGKIAYHHAVLGSFVESEQFAMRDKGTSNPSVTKIFTRDSKSLSSLNSSGVNLSFFLDQKTSSIRLETVTHLEDENGVLHDINQTQIEKSYFSRGLLGADGSIDHKFTVVLDRQAYLNKKKGSLLLISETRINDPFTRAKEINRYAKEVEITTQQPGIFPDFPSKIPDPFNPGYFKKVYYGGSSFYFGYTLSEDEIRKFLNTDFNKFYSIFSLSKFEIDRSKFIKAFAHAKKAIQVNPQTNESSTALYKALCEIFSDRDELVPLSQLLAYLVTTDTKSPYSHSGPLENAFLLAQNSAFGNIENQNLRLKPLAQLIRNSDQEMGILNSPTPNREDPNAIISVLSTKLTGSNDTPEKDRKLEISFDLSSEPDFIYFLMRPETSGHAEIEKNYKELLVFNRDHRFKKGMNKITLDPLSLDEIERRLSAKVHHKIKMKFSLGYRTNNQKWGPGVSLLFDPSSFYPAVSPNIKSNN